MTTTTLRALRRTVSLLALGLAPMAAGAQGITGLFNTGVDAGGNKMPVGSQDMHYTVNQNAGAQAFVYNHPAYIVDPSSAFIWQQADGNPGYSTRTFQTTFNVTSGYDPNTAFVSGQWSVDNYGLDILLNGISTGLTNFNGFQTFTSFAINSGFVAGTNTLEFVVQDVGPPGALAVRALTGNASLAVTSTPEPSTVVLMATGFIGLGITRLRRKRAS
jgi:hypothetical protein